MCNLIFSHSANGIRFQRLYGDGVSGEGHEFNLKSASSRMYKNDCSNIADGQAFRCEIAK